ncbi:lipid A biosynthesis (KDO)2-(lauroyl)-lipid IVA acyltransferase [Vibrio cholerae]|uniref:LpxL/LpxP family acyltransferase n=1 Tax=Vibrio cholerae TaxID=666 RepID=UPI0011D66B03|nr:hypothetical protein [Vibrio cholerae]TXY20007.1 hypothetical protein FXE97_00275 [Vibrio cholerae]GHY12817.1 lipid A biosynthesis (KDO)2-(lauroyl)-lipid IVA acyltransferase [Vibrio cholerae]
MSLPRNDFDQHAYNTRLQWRFFHPRYWDSLQAIQCNMYVTSTMFWMSFASTTLRSNQWLEKQTAVHGLEHVEQILANGENAILLVPHTWLIDILAILLASLGLPDEDLGHEHNVFVNFFANPKSPIAELGLIPSLSKVKVVHFFAMFNTDTENYELDFYPPLPLPRGDKQQDIQLMNGCIEAYVTEHPEQYMWILHLLKTRPDSVLNPYQINIDSR